jgi:hypothetical protein
MDKSIMPECFADTLLIETLIPTQTGYNHQASCTKVEGQMKKGKLKDRFAVGIIDKDKRQVKYLNEFESIDRVEGSLILWRHREKVKHHYFIQICPALETWILNICKAEEIDLATFGFSDDLEAITYYTKSQVRVEDKRVKDLFGTICKKNENISIRKLKYWITLLKDENYHIDINALKNG